MARAFDLITFDFDGVLLHNNFNDLFLDCCRELGLTWAKEREAEVARFIHDYYGGGEAKNDYETHGREGFWPVANRRFLAALASEGDLDGVAQHLTAQLRDAEVLYFHETGVHELLERLRQEGYRLAMLTNRDDKIHEFGAEWDLIAPFEFIGTRDTVGKAKPEPDLFHHISQHFDVPATRSLHVGDNPYADVRGAQAAGWQCLLLDPDNLFPDWDVPRLPTLHDLPAWLAGSRQ